MTTLRRHVAPRKQSEADFQAGVIDLARIYGWRVAHFRAARQQDGAWRTPVAADGKGFPDLVLVHPQRGVLFRELKTDVGHVTAEQEAWLDRLAGAGCDAKVWRPADWPEIRHALSHGRAEA